MADAMEAITDVMSEVQVRMNGEDASVRVAHRVEQGGTVGRAQLGYLNVRRSSADGSSTPSTSTRNGHH